MLFALFLTLPLLLSSVVTGAPITASAAPIAFVLLGDSTTYSANGWGNGFCSSLAQITTSYCRNYAVSGTTTGDLLASQNFKNALATIRTFVAEGRDVKTTIQYGHNDQKIATPESMGKVRMRRLCANGWMVKSDVEPHAHRRSSPGGRW